jgi:hypothetical protein
MLTEDRKIVPEVEIGVLLVRIDLGALAGGSHQLLGSSDLTLAA